MIAFLVLIVGVLAFLALRWDLNSQVGQAPTGARLERVKASPNYREGAFQNKSVTPSLAEGYSMLGVFYNFFFNTDPGTIPNKSIPSIKTNLHTLPLTEDVLVWMGHSSYYFQLNGKRFLVDPVLSGNAAPIPGSNRSFEGSDIYTVADIPAIDYLLISHDHYDHLDYVTVKELQSRVGQVICGLGVGQHLEYWGYPATKIVEKDWEEEVQLENGMSLITQTSRHFSGRMFSRNNTLWLSFVLTTPDFKMYLGGDSGYDRHFKAIGEKYGPFDLAIIENGQYNLAWHYIHLLPEEGLQAAVDLQAKRVLPVHSSKFKLALHLWQEPLEKLTQLNEVSHQLPIVTPKIGEMVKLKDTTQVFEKWWRAM